MRQPLQGPPLRLGTPTVPCLLPVPRELSMAHQEHISIIISFRIFILGWAESLQEFSQRPYYFFPAAFPVFD
jgi:hypothetical protein